MTVTIDKKAGVVNVSGIVVSDAPADPQAVTREYCAQAMEALRDAHAATQLDDAKLGAMVAAKQVEADKIKACRPTVVEKSK